MTGGVGGNEYGVTCPECGKHTPLGMGDDPNEGVECGGDWPGRDDWGCGRTLRVRVEVVSDVQQAYEAASESDATPSEVLERIDELNERVDTEVIAEAATREEGDGR
jgi:hypothetical protein